jgi:uncharacterized phiE125 gp8 family phage protein
MSFQPLASPWWRIGDLEEVTPNTVSAVPLDELKAFLKITTVDDDAELARAAVEATRMLQFEIGRATTSWALRLHLDGFPYVIDLPYPPLIGSVTSVKYIDTDAVGTELTLASTEYQVHATRDFARIIPAYGKSWPSVRTQYSAVKVAYTAGFAAVDMPPEVKLAVKWKVKLNREDQLTGTIGRELRDGYDRILNSLRRAA